LGEAEAFLRARGHTLAIDLAVAGASRSIDAWLAQGLPGSADRYSDPVFAPLAGFTARVHGGPRITLRPSPRRAVGPDLSALFLGMGGAFGRVERAVLVALRADAERPAPLAFDGVRDPALDPSERAAIERLSAVLSTELDPHR
jgi:alkyldihydroxyacetonephosphate synthase